MKKAMQQVLLNTKYIISSCFIQLFYAFLLYPVCQCFHLRRKLDLLILDKFMLPVLITLLSLYFLLDAYKSIFFSQINFSVSQLD